MTTRVGGFIAVLALTVAACTGSASDPISIETDRNMDATLPSGMWSATRMLRVTSPNGDLVIEGEDANERRIILHINAEVLAMSGANGSVTVTLTPQSAPLSGFALVTEFVSSEMFTGLATWTTAEGASATGTVTFTERTSDRVIGTFSFVAGAPVGAPYAVTRAATNGTLNIRLR